MPDKNGKGLLEDLFKKPIHHFEVRANDSEAVANELVRLLGGTRKEATPKGSVMVENSFFTVEVKKADSEHPVTTGCVLALELLEDNSVASARFKEFGIQAQELPIEGKPSIFFFDVEVDGDGTKDHIEFHTMATVQ